MKLRLDKYLADMGIGTRTEVKKAITKYATLVVRVRNGKRKTCFT